MNVIKNHKQKIKIAVPSNDGKIIFEGMLGRANTFFIFGLDNKNITLVEKRKNPYAETMQRLKTLDVYDLLEDCSVILSAKIGKKLLKDWKNAACDLFLLREKFKNN